MRAEHSVTPTLQIWLAAELDAAFDPAILSAAESERYRHLRSPRKRKEFELSRTLFHQLAPTHRSTSLSHSGGLVALAISEPTFAIGVDIETHKPRDVISLARFAFGRDEAEALAELPNASESFYALWVLKEACAKALSLPLVEALKTCVFRIEDRIISGVLPTAHCWRAYVWHPRPDVSLGAVAIGAREPITVQLSEWPASSGSWPVAATVAAGAATLL